MTTRSAPPLAASRRLALAAACLLFAAPLRAAPEYRAIHGATSDDYQKWVEQAQADGYRPIYVNGYNAGGKPQFAGVAIKSNNGPAWEARHQLTADQYQKTFDQMTNDGYRPICVSGYMAGKKPRFAGVWVKDDKSVRWEARHNLSPDEYQDTVTALAKDGLRPSVVAGYPDGAGGYRFTALFVGAGNTAWEARHNLTADDYQKEIDNWSPKGYRPTTVSVYETPDGLRFAVVFVKDDKGWVARHGLTADEYQKEFDQQAADGCRPLSVCGYRDGDEVRYAAVWVKPK